MPGLQPAPISGRNLDELIRGLNYTFKDVYFQLEKIFGHDNKVFSPQNIELPTATVMTEHDHTSADEGGDHPWADFTAGDVAYLQALVADITQTNLVDKSNNEVILGNWTFANTGLRIYDTDSSHDLNIKPGSNITANRVLTITTGDSDRTITLDGNPTLNDWFDQGLKQADSPTFNNISVTGTVDGVDIAALKTDVDGFPDELKNLVTAEIQQLENIGATTISAAQWGYLGATDQGIATSDSPIFVGLTLSDNLIMGNDKYIGQAAGPKLTFDDTDNHLELTGGDLFTDRYGSSVSNTILGVGVMGAGNFTTADYCTAIGNNALYSITSGNHNVGIGYYALYYNTSGQSNTAFGSTALYKNTTASRNTAFGRDALRENTVGFDNSAVGYYALRSNTTGDYNIAFGSYALRYNTTGNANQAWGYQALQNNTTGSYNVAFGNQALTKNTTASYSIAIGASVLKENTTGERGIAIGDGALENNTTGGYNLAIGIRALNTNTIGTYGLALGFESLYGVTEGNYNTGIGYKSGRAITTGDYNFLLGYQAGDNLTTGSRNVIVGYDIDASAVDVDDELNVGDALYGDLANNKIAVGALPLTNECDVGCLNDGVLALKETTTPTADADYAKFYSKNDNCFYGQDGAGTEHTFADSTGTTGGAGSAGAGNQYVEIRVGASTYKVLHDGTV